MKERVNHVWQPFMDEQGECRWPENQEQRNELATRLFGACVVSCMDYWLELALELIRNSIASPQWRREHVTWEGYESARKAFSMIPPEQRQHVEKLLFNTVQGVVFSILVKMDQFPGGLLKLHISDLENMKNAEAVVGELDAFHDTLSNWIDEFSEYAKEFNE